MNVEFSYIAKGCGGLGLAAALTAPVAAGCLWKGKQMLDISNQDDYAKLSDTQKTVRKVMAYALIALGVLNGLVASASAGLCIGSAGFFAIHPIPGVGVGLAASALALAMLKNAVSQSLSIQ